MTSPAFAAALAAARAVHDWPAVAAFHAFDPAPSWRGATPYAVPAATAMRDDAGLTTPEPQLRDPFIALWDQVTWRETYKDTDIGDDFLTRFGCYELIGVEGPFASTKMRGFIVYMPAGLYYEWHHHPAEEQYTLLAGAAEFQTLGKDPVMAEPGRSIFHPSNAPHRMATHDLPVLAWVAWRPPHLDIGPVLSGPVG